MKNKKMWMSMAVAMGVSMGMYLYFKNNPYKLECLKQKIGKAVYDFEDDMMM